MLVSQVHRSGGTLLTRLLDGHPAVRVFPHELGTLLQSGPLPRDADGAWERLHDPKLDRRYRRGLKQARASRDGDRGGTPFLVSPGVHRRLFDALLAGRSPTSDRDLLNAYVTAYFNASLGREGGLEEGCRWVVGFEPFALANGRRMALYRAAYPDGRILTVVREPASWYASARGWSPRFASIGLALELWSASTRAAVRLAGESPQAVLVLAFDDLVLRPEATMRAVARFLSLDFDEALLTPTVGGAPVQANSSFENAGYAVSGEPASRADLLTPHERRLVDRRASGLYEQALDVACRAPD